ncbi:MAG: AMP-binding protein [Planctomycetota bacterium]
MLGDVLDTLLRSFVQACLWLRYRTRVRGLDSVARRGMRGIVFLPNHPALIDPVIVMAALHGRFAPRPLADQRQIDRFFVRWLARRIGARPLPDVRADGPAVRAGIEAVVQDCVAGLHRGENLLLYPAGHLARGRHEDLSGNSAVETILREAPDARVVLVRTRGLWGSSFSLATGHVPDVGRILRRAFAAILANFVFFTPRRAVTLEFCEPADLPRCAPRAVLNDYLERFYNADAPPALYVPNTRWEAGGPHTLPEPDFGEAAGAANSVPETTRKLVTDFLREQTGELEIRDEQRLAQDLGLDSLVKTELLLWLGREFGVSATDVDALQTVGDVLLAARGEAVVARPAPVPPPPARWFRGPGQTRLDVPPGDALTAVFLAQARRGPERAAIADPVSGVRSYRDLLTGILALKPSIEAWPEERVGFMLPASVGAALTYFATLFAGRTPVLVNWTTGGRNMAHGLEVLGVRHVLTARALVSRLESQGTDLAAIRDRFVYLEELRATIGLARKLAAAAQARLSWKALDGVRATETAAILMTSGSETLPKAVPLTHANILANIRDVLRVITVYETDCLIGFLPPFHSFGLTVTLVLPLLVGARAVCHANPTEAWVLARLINAYRANILVGTPTFLSGILRAAAGTQLASLRIAVTGAEQCPSQVYERLRRAAPRAAILEGYGVTECSPIVSVNREENARPGTIGQPLPSFEIAVVDPERGTPASPGATGLLLVRGPSVFPGYIGPAASPFVEHAGKLWYRTGDLVSSDERGVLTFRGRLKRFVKLGGEMISLPAIEAVLDARFGAPASDEGPAIAVTSTADEQHPEIVLFATRALDRPTVNQSIRAAGLSALHNVSRIVQVERIPLLGTGKVDYRALQASLGVPAAVAAQPAS